MINLIISVSSSFGFSNPEVRSFMYLTLSFRTLSTNWGVWVDVQVGLRRHFFGIDSSLYDQLHPFLILYLLVVFRVTKVYLKLLKTNLRRRISS